MSAIGPLQDSTTRELLLLRELYGHLLTLATRPLSAGNYVTHESSRKSASAIVENLLSSGVGLMGRKPLSLVRNMLGAVGPQVPVQAIAGAVVQAVGQLLRDAHGESLSNCIQQYSEPDRPMPLSQLFVSIGPTIGVGDEFILAVALGERASQYGVELHVETSRPDLWELLDQSVDLVGAPPTALLNRLSSLRQPECCGYLYADFLDSDPCPLPTLVPHGLARVARWIMGDGRVQMVSGGMDVSNLRVPYGMPSVKSLECDWVAARIIPDRKRDAGFVASASLGATPVLRRRSGKVCEVLLSVLTSKQALMLGDEFWARSLQRARILAGASIHVSVLSGVTASERELTRSVSEAIGRVLGVEAVTHLDRLSLLGVARRVASADCVVGPDTFTAHLAHHFATPQVAVGLAEHGGWKRAASRSFYVTLGPGMNGVVRAIGSRLAIVMNAERVAESSSDLARDARTWADSLHSLETEIRAYVQGGPMRADRVDDAMASVERVLRTAPACVREVLSEYDAHRGAGAQSPRRSDYRTESDFSSALQGWYHEIGTSDLSALLTCLT